MGTRPRTIIGVVAVIAAFVTMGWGTADARPATRRVACGETIFTSTTLTASVGPCSGPGIIIGADNVTLNLNGYFVIGNFDRGAAGEFPGIVVNGRRNVTVIGNAGGGRGEGTGEGTVEGFEAGVSIEGGGANTIQGLTVQDNMGPVDLDTAFYGDGILVLRSGDNRIVDNTVLRNGIYDGIGILAPGSDRNWVANNHVANTRTGELEDELNVQNGVGIIVNNFFDIDQPDRGIPVFDNRVVGNVVRDNDGPGISTASNINGKIIGNLVQNNGHSLNNFLGGNGIGVQRSAFILISNFNNLVQDNISTGNARDGIRIDSGPVGNLIINNRATGNSVNWHGAIGWDLNDMNRGCGPFPPNPALANVWDANVYTTFSQPCVTAGGTQVPGAVAAARAAEGTSPPADAPPPPRRR